VVVIAQRVTARTAEAGGEPASGNPLWALPLNQLSATRERPIFSPSRRPPPPARPAYIAPVAIREPVKPPEPARPAVSLIGTIMGSRGEDQIGVFLDTGTQSIIRLRAGEEHQGWVLRQVKAREVTLVKDGGEAVVLTLPAPGEVPPPGMLGVLPPGIQPGMVPGIIPVPGVPPSQRQHRQGR
jgi:general secretion pathway protein N